MLYIKSKFAIALLFLCGISMSAFAQLNPITLKQPDAALFIQFGYSRSWFDNTDLHFKNDNYDFTLQNVAIEDYPHAETPDQWAFNTPQLNFKVGYFFKRNNILGVELSFNHIRQNLSAGQKNKFTGVIYDQIFDVDTSFSAKDLNFMQANGSGVLMLSMISGATIFQVKKEKQWLQFLFKPGVGIALPRTYVNIFGRENQHEYNGAGYAVGLETSLRYVLGRHFIIESGARGSFTNYTNLLTVDGGQGDYSVLSVTWISSIGYQFRF